MKSRLLFALTLMCFLTGCSFFGGNKDTKNLVADGLTPKELYEQAEDKVDAGSIEQAIDQYEMILSSYPGSKYAIQARLDIAFNLLKQKKYNRSITEKSYEGFPTTKLLLLKLLRGFKTKGRDKDSKKDFYYTTKTLDNFGRIFSSKGEDAPLKKYSAKIYSIINQINKIIS